MSSPLTDNPHEFEPDGTRRSPFTTRAQMAFREGGRTRMLWAVALGALALVLVLLLSPDPDTLLDNMRDYGAPGELQIMPQISIEDGQDAAHQLPTSLQTPPPPSRMEIEKEETSETGTEPAPQEQDDSEVIVQTDMVATNPESELAQTEQVELQMPMQSNPDFFILHQVHPQYPLGASESERRTPLIFVKVAVWVNPAGDVTEAMIMGTNGSRIFATEVLEKVKLWKFGWRVPEKTGRWISMIYNFKSPYFTPAASGD